MDDADGHATSAGRGLDTPGGANGARNNVVVKVGMVGDAQVGKTSLMVKYVEGKFDEDYIHTLVFKVVLSKVFDLKCTVPMIEKIGDPILQY
ncbi:hypothetical protein P43SY_005582 [Pythium insidiosum]|uniref:Uncharacterized protein n=1 Tax=Pythium insidiosum TaxID=114742 RepID=A0AAD5M6M5_PYTIN|nr:hypothetical protein P43SY_005582 [Pythium insidiosum]